MNPTSCYNLPEENVESPSSGKDVLNKIDEVISNSLISLAKMINSFNFQNTVRGLTEEIRFDTDGLRDMFYIEVLELQRSNDTGDSYRKIAIYESKYGIKLLRNFGNVEEQTAISMQAKIFKVILREGMPFLRKK